MKWKQLQYIKVSFWTWLIYSIFSMLQITPRGGSLIIRNVLAQFDQDREPYYLQISMHWFALANLSRVDIVAWKQVVLPGFLGR